MYKNVEMNIVASGCNQHVWSVGVVSRWCIYLIIIESVNSISRDERDAP